MVVADEDASHLATPAPPSRVSLSRFLSSVSPSPRRLSSRFSKPSRPASPARRKLAWVSLQGRLVGAEEATSARAVGPLLGQEDAVAWELLSPLHRVLVVAAVAAATSRSKSSKKILQLQRSIDLRDQILLGMQQKLDDLCEEMNFLQDRSMKYNGKFYSQNEQLVRDRKAEEEGDKFFGVRPFQIELNPESGITPLCRKKDINGVEPIKDELTDKCTAMAEQEERRMSDLSDFCWSVTSSVDNQLSSLAVEQEFYNLRKECEEKDATIKELTAAAHASSVADSKRIAEIQEMVRRKNMIITKLKKDMAFLEQKVVELTRIRRSSSVATSSESPQLPVMSNNLLYDMSSTSSSSSDTESPIKEHHIKSTANCTFQQQGFAATESQRQLSPELLIPLNGSPRRPLKQQYASPCSENRIIHRVETTPSVRQRHSVSSTLDFKRTRRHTQQELKNKAQKRWV
ncbi:uncharacterized protein [Typha latifolia]|uniref:uncharacterized protein n=1 Tax=Typha latifolia TaxID=4733 RepID=UPI003C2D51C8